MPMPIGGKNLQGFVDDFRAVPASNVNPGVVNQLPVTLVDANGNGLISFSGVNNDGGLGSGAGLAAAAMMNAVTGSLASSAVRLRTPNVFKNIAAVAVTAATPVTIWTPAAGKKFRLMGWALSLSVAGSVLLIDNATEIMRTPLMAAGVGLVAPPIGNGILSAAINQLLKIDVSATGSVSGFVFGTEE